MIYTILLDEYPDYDFGMIPRKHDIASWPGDEKQPPLAIKLKNAKRWFKLPIICDWTVLVNPNPKEEDIDIFRNEVNRYIAKEKK